MTRYLREGSPLPKIKRGLRLPCAIVSAWVVVTIKNKAIKGIINQEKLCGARLYVCARREGEREREMRVEREKTRGVNEEPPCRA